MAKARGVTSKFLGREKELTEDLRTLKIKEVMAKWEVSAPTVALWKKRFGLVGAKAKAKLQARPLEGVRSAARGSVPLPAPRTVGASTELERLKIENDVLKELLADAYRQLAKGGK